MAVHATRQHQYRDHRGRRKPFQPSPRCRDAEMFLDRLGAAASTEGWLAKPTWCSASCPTVSTTSAWRSTARSPAAAARSTASACAMYPDALRIEPMP